MEMVVDLFGDRARDGGHLEQVVEPGFLDRKLVIVEERYGSMEADYSIRVLQSRKKLIAAAPVKDPQTGNMRTKVFMVEAATRQRVAHSSRSSSAGAKRSISPESRCGL